MILIAASLLLLGAGQPEAGGLPAADDTWAVRPSLMITDYPQAALDAGIDGEAIIRCEVSPEGVPSACEPLAEEPAGYGFGAAAAAVVQRGRLTTAAVSEMGADPWFTVRIPFEIEPEPEFVAPDDADGFVTLSCHLGQALQAEGCVILDETPSGAGFGEAALRIMEGRTLAPEVVAGQNPGTPFTIRMPFRIPQE